MGVVSVNEIASGRQGTDELEKFRRQYTRVFRVKTDNNYTSAEEVKAHPSIPFLSQPYITSTESDAGALVKKRDATQDGDNPNYWLVKVDYDTDLPDPANQQDNPTLRPPDFKTQFARGEEFIDKDRFGNPLVNAAGTRFPNPQKRIRSTPNWSISVNRLTTVVSYPVLCQLVDKVNLFAYAGFAPGVLRIANIETDLQYEKTFPYVRVTYFFEVDYVNFWQLIILNEGMLTPTDLGGNPQLPGQMPKEVIRDRYGLASPVPVLLGLDGTVLEQGEEPTYMTYEIYDPADFSGIP